LLSEQRENRGDLDAAKDLLRQAIEAKPGERNPYLNLARIQKNEGKQKEAADTLQLASARFPDDSLVQESLAIGYELMQDYDAAKLAYENVLVKWPNDIVAANNLAMLIADIWPTDKALLDREAWIRRRVEMHHNPSGEPFEQQTTDGKWYRISERRTADGGCLGIWTDITALKNAEARLRDAIESVNEGFALFDPEMRYVIANSNLIKMYPVSGKLAKPGARLEDVLRYGAEHGEYPGVETPAQIDAFVKLWMDRFTSAERYLGEGEMPDGRWYLVSHHPTSNGGYVSIRADITAQKKREAELSGAMSDLEIKTLELAVLAEELEQARRTADLANLGKSNFLANMAHELRTPLNAINGFSELILNETFGAIQPERYKGYVEYIHQGGSHLLSLINDILDLSKIEAGRMELHIEAVPTEQVAYQAIESLRKTADERKVSLRAEIAPDCPILHADPRAIRQILLNLLSNAVKFTPALGSVTLGVECAGDEGFRITVADTGVGMSAPEIVKALEPYGQVESDLAKKQQGTGLGLPLVKSLAELHRGAMNLESQKGKGTTVTVLLPWQMDLPRGLH
jgi:signal transduction histidine kinase